MQTSIRRKMRDEKDEIVTSSKGIANTFATFYSNLHAKEKQHDDKDILRSGCTKKSQRAGRKQGSTNEGKLRRNRWIRAEDIKEWDDETQDMVKAIFSEIIRQENIASEARAKVVTKSDSQKRRCGVSTLLYNRLCSKLDPHQPPDQRGFRCNCQAVDHLATYRLLEQKSKEWCVIARAKEQRMGGTIHHEATWKSLSKFNVSKAYVCLLKNNTQTSMLPS